MPNNAPNGVSKLQYRNGMKNENQIICSNISITNIKPFKPIKIGDKKKKICILRRKTITKEHKKK